MNVYDISSIGTIGLTNLYAGTNYQVCGYAENIYNNWSAGSVAYFSTTAQDTNATWSISASGPNATAVTADTVGDIVSYYQGVNPARNIALNVAYTAPTARRLQTTDHSYVFSGVLASDRTAESPATASIAALAAAQATSVNTEVHSELGTSFTVGAYADGVYAPAQTTVTFTTTPALDSETSSAVTIGLASDNAGGEIACVVLNEQSQTEYSNTAKYAPSAEQVYLGLDVNNQAAVSATVIDASGATSITVSDLAKGTKYSAFCTATNGYLVWPAYTAVSAAVNFTTDGTADTDDDDDDSALLVSSNLVAICTMIAALIFN